MLRLILILLWSIGCLLWSIGWMSSQAEADQLELIKARGKILVGIRGDAPPFAIMDAAGERRGLEVEVGRKVAEHLSVAFEPIVVGSSEWVKRLEDGTIDLLIAGVPDTEPNRKSMSLIEPSYFAGGVYTLVPASFTPVAWSELRGKLVCLSNGSPFNDSLSLRYALDPVMVGSVDEARRALEERRCSAWAADSPAMLEQLGRAGATDFHMPLEPILAIPWSMAARKGKDSAELVRSLGDLVAEWHRDGTLTRLERSFSLPPHPFLATQNELWSRQNAKGKLYCYRRDDGRWRPKCRNQISDEGVEAVAAGALDHLDVINDRGTILVGVKTDYVPFGSYDAAGQLNGFDVALARLVAERLGVDLRLVGVNTANRLQRLEEGAIDLVIATMADTERRRQIATLIEPSYYASGVNIMTHKSVRPTDWSELRGRTVCVNQGAYFNTTLAQRYLMDLQVFGSVRDTKLALADHRCVGWAYDEPGLLPALKESAFADYHLPLGPILVVPWGMAVRKGPEYARLARLLGGLVAEWHREGTLIELERDWQLPASDFLLKQRELWTRTNDSGNLYCSRAPDGDWRPNCRNPAFITASETSGLTALGLRLREATGLDLTVVYDQFERDQFLRGLAITLALVVTTVVGSVLFGLLTAGLVETRVPLVAPLLTMFATFARMTPPLLQLYVVFFGFGGLLLAGVGWSPSAFAAAALCLSIYAGASNLFAFRDAAEALRAGRGPISDRTSPAESILAKGTLAAIFRLAYPAVMSNCVNVIKATGLASAIAVPEIISASTAILAERGNAFVMMNLLLIAYFVIVWSAVRLFAFVERRIGVENVAR